MTHQKLGLIFTYNTEFGRVKSDPIFEYSDMENTRTKADSERVHRGFTFSTEMQP
jgi:hypothetical protein